jgi:hypothetical protein
MPKQSPNRRANQPNSPKYPIGTVIAYGPDNTRATKLVAAVFKRPGRGADELHRWFVQGGDIRHDPGISAEVAEFFKQRGVKATTTYDRIVGCPHEEGIDYPMGRKCPHCPFWANIDRFTHEPIQPPAPTRTPEQILAELSAVRDTPPLEALQSAEAHREALIEPLLAAIERGLENPSGTPEDEAMLFSYATYLLAKWRETRAYPFMVRWLLLPGESAHEIGGDTVTQAGHVLLASVFDGNLEPIKSLILNREANEYCRGQAVKALAVLGVWGELPREIVEEHLLWLARDGLERKYSVVWDHLASACADVEAVRTFPELRRAYDEGLIDPGFISRSELDEVEAGPRGERIERQRKSHPPIDDVAEATSWWGWFKRDEQMSAQPLAELAPQQAPLSEPSPPPLARSSPKPKTGRNEPCPCGSGKKYKKCCGK